MPTISEIHAAILAAAGAAGEARLEALRVGHFWTVVQTSRGTGMASTLRSERHLHGSHPIAGAGSLHELDPSELADRIRSTSPPDASVGLAAANALIRPPDGRLTDDNAETILADRGRGKRVAMIGRFPFTRRLRSHVGELWVFERGEHRRDGDLGPEDMVELLPDADVVGITSTTILNRSLPEILDLLPTGAFVLLLGPSTPLTDRLFDFGIDLLCGTLVTEPGAVVRAVEQGAVTSQISGVRRVCLWPQGDSTRRREGAEAQRG